MATVLPVARARWLIFAFALALFAPTLVFGRVDWDDRWLWADDSPLRHLDAHTLHEVFFQLDRHARHPLGSEYLPVRDVAVALDMAVWGGSEHGPHGTQVLLFGLTVLALGGLLVRFGVPHAVAWLGALIWAAHPIHVESVAWLAERKGVLAGLFVLLCGHAWVRYREGRSVAWLAAAALCAIAGVWSKAPAMFGPPALAAWDLLLLPAATALARRRRWVAIAVIGAATAGAAVPVIVLADEAHVIGVAEAGGDREGRAATAIGVEGHYLQSIVLARPMAMSYPINSLGPTPVDLALGAAAMLASIGGLAWWWRRERARGKPVRGLGGALLAWAWIAYIPIGHVLVPLHIIAADRFAYLWSIAPCVAAAWAIWQLPVRARLPVAGAVVLVLALATIRDEGTWNTSVDVFGNGCASNPDDITACGGWAGALDEEGRRAEALRAIGGSLARHPDDPYLLMKRAWIYERASKRDLALADAEHAARAGVGSALNYYAQLLLRSDRPLDAIPFATRAMIRHPELPEYGETLVIAFRVAAKLPPPRLPASALAPHP